MKSRFSPLVSIGFDVMVHETVTVGEFTKLADGTWIGANTVIGSFVRTGKSCMIGAGVTVKTQTIISPDTIIEDNVFIGPGVMILHDTLEGDHLPVKIRTGAYIGARACIAAGVTIGKGAIVGAMAFVNKDVPPHTTVIGIPAKEMKK